MAFLRKLQDEPKRGEDSCKEKRPLSLTFLELVTLETRSGGEQAAKSGASCDSFPMLFQCLATELALAGGSLALVPAASFIEWQFLCLARVTTSPGNPGSLFCISQEILSLSCLFSAHHMPPALFWGWCGVVTGTILTSLFTG